MCRVDTGMAAGGARTALVPASFQRWRNRGVQRQSAYNGSATGACALAMPPWCGAVTVLRRNASERSPHAHGHRANRRQPACAQPRVPPVPRSVHRSPRSRAVRARFPAAAPAPPPHTPQGGPRSGSVRDGASSFPRTRFTLLLLSAANAGPPSASLPCGCRPGSRPLVRQASSASTPRRRRRRRRRRDFFSRQNNSSSDTSSSHKPNPTRGAEGGRCWLGCCMEVGKDGGQGGLAGGVEGGQDTGCWKRRLEARMLHGGREGRWTTRRCRMLEAAAGGEDDTWRSGRIVDDSAKLEARKTGRMLDGTWEG